MGMDQVEHLIVLAEKIYTGTLLNQDALNELQKYNAVTGKAADTVHLLYHFIADADLRLKDKSYAAIQCQHLRRVISALKAS